MSRDIADRILTQNGWLSRQPRDFQLEVLSHSILERYEAKETIYRFEGPLGGAYGLVSGTLSVNASTPGGVPRIIHVGSAGSWTGEGCFLTRQPRRIELRALVETWLMHLPLSAMDRMAEKDPTVIRNFAQILVASTDTLIRVVHDLQKPEADKRIASILQRVAWSGPTPISLSQTELGVMANASRKQVNAALRKFAEAGWLSHSYRSVSIIKPEELLRYSESD
ncbi:Crp/Fnr family transcriptional regulator [Pseudoxanthomonas kalamensis]|uniref:Crp/Fnr family transcriptional regulator n=1 Tax=Pseudoxanthomonas kalamensis TaxID=289483 RepID=UPI001B88477B|nr:Crp/Fnr family transcriptional regulator [Pseudoxanthomonas kalamensis]